MTPSTTQSDQERSKEQQQSGKFQGQQGGQSSARDEEKQQGSRSGRNQSPETDSRHPCAAGRAACSRSGRNQSPETDGGGTDDGDDVQGRAGKSEVHPDAERGDDPDDETAEKKSW